MSTSVASRAVTTFSYELGYWQVVDNLYNKSKETANLLYQLFILKQSTTSTQQYYFFFIHQNQIVYKSKANKFKKHENILESHKKMIAK